MTPCSMLTSDLLIHSSAQAQMSRNIHAYESYAKSILLNTLSFRIGVEHLNQQCAEVWGWIQMSKEISLHRQREMLSMSKICRAYTKTTKQTRVLKLPAEACQWWQAIGRMLCKYSLNQSFLSTSNNQKGSFRGGRGTPGPKLTGVIHTLPSCFVK